MNNYLGDNGNLGELVAASGKGSPVELTGVCEDFTFTVTDETGVAINATIKVQGSVCDKQPADDDDYWYDLISVAAKGHTQVIGKPTRWLRRNITVYVAGTINIYFAGK
jgi:hypothetical protein